jgi:hypothetical protein
MYIMPSEVTSTAYFIYTSFSNTDTAVPQTVEVITVIVMKLGIKIMPHESFSTAYVTNTSLQ